MRKPTPSSSRPEKEAFIRAKYETRQFVSTADVAAATAAGQAGRSRGGACRRGRRCTAAKEGELPLTLTLTLPLTRTRTRTLTQTLTLTLTLALTRRTAASSRRAKRTRPRCGHA